MGATLALNGLTLEVKFGGDPLERTKKDICLFNTGLINNKFLTSLI